MTTSVISGTPLSEVKLHCVDDVDTASELMRWLGDRRRVLSCDTESGGLNFKTDALRLIQFGDDDDGWAIPWDRWGGVAQEVLKRYDGKIVLHNRPFDANFMLEKGVIDRWPWERSDDTMVMAHCLNPVRSKALKSLTSTLIDKTAAAGQDALHRFMSASDYTWATIPVDNQYYWGYGAMDAVLTSRLHGILRPQVDASCREVYEMELAVQRICANMSRRGTFVDLRYCEETARQLRTWVAQARAWCLAEFGIKNATSNLQVIRYFEGVGIEIEKMTPTGQTALDKEVLLGIDHPLAEAILSIRKAEKLCSTYLDNFEKFADADGFIHPTIWTCGTRTARMSVTDPAFQTLPKNDKTVRNAVVPEHGRRLITCDADQIELRLMAHFAKDQGLIAAFNETAAAAAAGETDPVKIDFFCRVATEMLGELIVKEDPRRKTTKNSWYARLYGAGPGKIAVTAGVPRWKIEEINAITDEIYPGIRRFMRATEAEIIERFQVDGDAYVMSHFGRRLPVDRDKAYTGVNYKIQCTAAEIFKRALIALDAAGFDEDMLLPVHDEVVLSVDATGTREAEHVIQEVMTQSSANEFLLPITWSAEVLQGAWGDRELLELAA